MNATENRCERTDGQRLSLVFIIESCRSAALIFCLHCRAASDAQNFRFLWQSNCMCNDHKSQMITTNCNWGALMVRCLSCIVNYNSVGTRKMLHRTFVSQLKSHSKILINNVSEPFRSHILKELLIRFISCRSFVSAERGHAICLLISDSSQNWIFYCFAYHKQHNYLQQISRRAHFEVITQRRNVPNKYFWVTSSLLFWVFRWFHFYC